MKLRTKLTVLSILLIVIAIALCCALLIAFAQESEMRDVTEAGLADYRAFYHAFWQACGTDLPAQPAVLRSYLIGAFRAIDGFSEYTLHRGGDPICNNVGFDPASAFPSAAPTSTIDEIDVRHTTVRTGGADYFVANAMLTLGGEAYALSLARNISPVTDGVRALAARCALVGSAVTVCAAALMWLLVYRSMRPVEKLRAGAAELARGNYGSRIDIGGRDELSALAAGFNAMADAIEANMAALHERSERQQAFINDLSHELKTPVTSILLSAETLRNRKVSPEAQDRSLSRIYDQGRWLEQLSQKLMTLVLLQGEIALRPESVAGLFDAVRETTAGALREQGMALSLDCGMDTLPMDVDLMRAALVNLVENARKASTAGQTIMLSARGGAIEVRDCGRGIPPGEIGRVIEPFYTVDRSRSKKHGGAGLGLALVGRIAEAHGARLEIESAVGKGTAVRIQFDEMTTI